MYYFNIQNLKSKSNFLINPEPTLFSQFKLILFIPIKEANLARQVAEI